MELELLRGEKMERPKILIINKYHPKEIFAARVGEYLYANNSNPDLKIVEYTGRADRKTSTYNLRRFIEEFDPVISPIILHDDDFEFDAAIVYCAKSRKERMLARKPLVNFVSNYEGLIYYGRFLTYNTKYNLIDLELNLEIGLGKAVDLVESFSKYLIDLYLNEGVKL